MYKTKQKTQDEDGQPTVPSPSPATTAALALHHHTKPTTPTTLPPLIPKPLLNAKAVGAAAAVVAIPPNAVPACGGYAPPGAQ